MAEDSEKTITFHYIKSADCREIKVSGVFGGMNKTTGDAHIAVFTERSPIPQEITIKLNKDGTLGEEQDREGKEGVIRVVQGVLHMDLATVLSVSEWLQKHIENFLKENPEIHVEKPDV